MSWPTRAPILCSYAFMRGTNTIDKLRGGQLFVDSGAFTAKSLGLTIDLSEYCDWLTTNRDGIHQAAALDVIGDWRATARNTETMLNKLDGVVPVIPVWHLGSPEHELRRLCQEHDYIAIGGCVPFAGHLKVLLAHLVRAHRIAREHGTRLHGLGVTGTKAVTSLPWYSVDSSSWGQSFRYGKVVLTNRYGKQDMMRLGVPLKNAAQVALVRAYDGDPQWFRTPGFCNRKARGKAQYDKDLFWVVSASARAYWVLGDVAGRRHGTNMTLYLADGGTHLPAAIAALPLGNPYDSKGT